jgi:hypothetical protein
MWVYVVRLKSDRDSFSGVNFGISGRLADQLPDAQNSDEGEANVMVDEGSRVVRTAFSSREKLWMLTLLLVGEAAGIGLAWFFSHRHNDDLSKLFATAATTLLFGALLGGIVTLLIADIDRHRLQRASQVDFVTNVLADLKAVHDQVDRGRMLILARKSAKTYGEQMCELIEAVVKLRNVERALDTDDRAKQIMNVKGQVTSMENYLRGLLGEYEDKYREMSLVQNAFEAKMKQALEGPKLVTCSVNDLPTNEPWQKLWNLEHLHDFLLPVDIDHVKGEKASQYDQRFL